MFKKITIVLIIISVMLLIPIDSFAQMGGGGRGGGGRGGMGGGRGGIAGGFAGTSGTGGTSSIVGTDETQYTLIPYPEKNWIIARAPAEVMEEIAKLIKELDMEGAQPTDYDTISVMYVDVDEVASSLETMMADLSPDFNRNVSIQPLVQSRQLLVFGKKQYRDMVKKLVQEIDLPSNQLQRKTFQLKYADPEDIKTKIDELFSLTGSTSSTGTRTTSTRTTATRTSYGTSGTGMLSADTVITTTYPSLRQIVVLASEDNLKEISKQIEDWDSPIVWEELKPRIISVKNIDPVQLVNLLNQLFSSSTTTSGGSSTNQNTRALLSSSTTSAQTTLGEKIIGPLYGKLTFVDIPDTKKIIVASNVAEAYDVIQKFIEQIDAAEPAVIPKVVQLKYADCEDLSRRLNTVFAESGTSSSIEMSVTGLSSTSSMGASSSSSTSTTPESYTPPWSGSGGSSSTETMPVSNIFGKVRFMPEPNTKSILLLAPAQFMDDLVGLIAQLDVTGKQVMIETIIVEVEHNAMTSLGLEFSSSGSALSSIGRYGLNAQGIFGEQSSGGDFDHTLIQNDDFVVSGIGLSVFIDFLVKEANAHILNQQTLWTRDNEEANFFKGTQIPFVTGTTSTTSSTGAVVNSDTYDFQLVGMEVRVRPSITPENNVNMIINVNYSQQTGDKGLGNMDILSEMNTTTNMIINDGDTLILGGTLFQKDSTITYKIPGLGDIPILKHLFSHDSVNRENTELLVFIKPHVIDQAPEDLDKLIDKTKKAIENSTSRLEQIQNQLNKSMSTLKK
jgi:general secretion pathway protein D